MDRIYLEPISGTNPVPYEQAHWEFDENGKPYIWMKDKNNERKEEAKDSEA